MELFRKTLLVGLLEAVSKLEERTVSQIMLEILSEVVEAVKPAEKT